jgi:RNA polymerase sigma-70 factor (ECF subfamily)
VDSAEALFTTHRDGIFRYLCRIVGPGDASDLTQEVFLRVSRASVPDIPPEALRAWIFRIARNLALNHRRDTGRRPATTELTDVSHRAPQETSLAMRQALDQLAPLDRDVFLLREVSGLSYGEIADSCDLTLDAVRSRLHRARQHLRAALQPLSGGTASIYVRLYDPQ